MDDISGPNIAGTCTGLIAADIERVTAFMAAAARAFALKDAALLETLSHAGGDPRGQKNTLEFAQSLMDGGDTIRSWSARPYTEPKWSIMKRVQHHPPPSVWVDATLHNGKREYPYPYCFALALDEGGELRSCYYVDRVRRRNDKRT